MNRKPVTGPIPATKQPKTGSIPPRQRITFSFRYFRQIGNFGLAQQDTGWFTSLLDKLRDLSQETLADLNADAGKKQHWRFHEINWNQQSIPIQRKDLNWIDSTILDNDAEYPMHQFQITTALGRIMGFFDSGAVFNVVLLDPLHNIQPAKKHNYQVRETFVSESVAAALMRHVEARLADCKHDDCVCRVDYQTLQRAALAPRKNPALIIGMSEDLLGKVSSLIVGGAAVSVAEILEIAVDQLVSDMDESGDAK